MKKTAYWPVAEATDTRRALSRMQAYFENRLQTKRDQTLVDTKKLYQDDNSMRDSKENDTKAIDAFLEGLLDEDGLPNEAVLERIRLGDGV